VSHIQWLRQVTEVDRVGEQAAVAELALRSRAKETACLRLLGFPSPRGLPLHSPERPEVAVSGEEFLYQCAASRPDELFLQVGVADVKTHALQVCACPERTEAGRRQATPNDALFRGVTQAGEPYPGAPRPEPPRVPGESVRAAGRDDRYALRAEVQAAAAGHRLHGNLVADPLDQDDGASTARLSQRHGRRLGCGGRTTHIAGQDLEIIAWHKTTVRPPPG
jgi:hypothetical protein